jgi:hypothetical protein
MTSNFKIDLVRRREIMVYILIFVIAGGSLFDIASSGEHWPFSRYPMFTSIRREYSLTQYKLFGVTKNVPPTEMNLLEPQYIQPLTMLHLSAIFKKKPDNLSYEKYIVDILTRILERYELLRLAGEHNGPELRGIRLYKYIWRLDPQGRPVEQPYERKLISETMNHE